MDALLYMSDMISNTRELIPLPKFYYTDLTRYCAFMKSTKFRDLSVDEQQALIKIFRRTAIEVGKLIGELVGHASRKQSSSSVNDLAKEYNEKIHYLLRGMWDHTCQYAGETMSGFPSNLKQILYLPMLSRIMSPKVENIENMILEGADISNMVLEIGSLFYKKAFTTYDSMQNDQERLMSFIYQLLKELNPLPHLIYMSWQEQPLAVALIGGLLSLRPMTYTIWNRVYQDVNNIKGPTNNATTDHMGQIFTYCYNDLPYSLQSCFLYFACYPVGSERPATSLTQIWIAEGFVEEEDKQMPLETTAYKYLDELVQRSLVFVSKRSLLGTTKYCRLPHSVHEFAIRQSYMEGFSVVNPNQEEDESVIRLAIYQDNKKQCTKVKNNHIYSFLAFNFDRNVLGSVMLLRVLALRNSAIPVTTLPNMIYLRYLNLRGSNISNLPENIGDMENLQTLDVRYTIIETLLESLWNIKTLRHVSVKPSLQIKGPPSEAQIDNLHTLRTVAAHESWLKKFPHFLIHLRKLAFSNWNNLDLKSISNLLSHMDKLISLVIMGKIIPSEVADLRAFPNLQMVMSIKLEGEWNCRKLIIDNVKFPPNLTKLTLIKSGLKEDPMPTLERLQMLKFLSLQDGAYTGKQMVCSARGFPKLQILELKKMENLENWEVEQGAMEQLCKLLVNQCRNHICNHPNLNHVADKVID